MKRFDLLLVEKGFFASRQRARAMIMAGKVLVNNIRIDKPGVTVSESDAIEILGKDIAFVSRGGLKLASALENFKLSVNNLVCLDVGASTGGFTDCLLQNGAARVYAVDVGYGQLAWKLRNDPRVVVFERTNIRHMAPETLPEAVDIVTVDVSFISLKIVIPAIMGFMQNDARIIALIKPQFEVGKGQVGKGGVVRDRRLHTKVIEDLTAFFENSGFASESVIPSPILGPKGNREFFIFLKLVVS
jgi:23S rRNA (cytidine1920-2'-O)/16S rRNA (cytidine1409-2'-O)-methyltransferase